MLHQLLPFSPTALPPSNCSPLADAEPELTIPEAPRIVPKSAPWLILDGFILERGKRARRKKVHGLRGKGCQGRKKGKAI